MAVCDIFNTRAEKVGEIDLNDSLFNVEVNTGILHEVVCMQRANRRSGNACTRRVARSVVVVPNPGDRKEQDERGREAEHPRFGEEVALYLGLNLGIIVILCRKRLSDSL